MTMSQESALYRKVLFEKYLDIALDSTKTLESLELRTIANEVVIGLMAVSLER